MWHEVNADDLHPPLYKKEPGRLKKFKFRELCEGGSRLRRVGITYRSTKCDKRGHNKRRCNEPTQDPNVLKIRVMVYFDTLLSYIMIGIHN